MISNLFNVYCYNLAAAMLLFILFSTSAMAQNAGSDGRFRIQLIPYQQSSIASEIAANISHMPLKEGATFLKGELLVQFDCSIINAQLNKSEAIAESARSTMKVNKRLAELNAVGSLELEQAIAKSKEAEADLKVMQVTASKCAIKAPFDGRILKLHADPFQYVTPGKSILDIVDTSRLEVKMIVPSRWLAWLKKSSHFSVQIEELGGRSYPAQVTRVGAKIDALSQTAVIAGEITGAYPELLPGMSGWASFGGGRRK